MSRQTLPFLGHLHLTAESIFLNSLITAIRSHCYVLTSWLVSLIIYELIPTTLLSSIETNSNLRSLKLQSEILSLILTLHKIWYPCDQAELIGSPLGQIWVKPHPIKTFTPSVLSVIGGVAPHGHPYPPDATNLRMCISYFCSSFNFLTRLSLVILAQIAKATGIYHNLWLEFLDIDCRHLFFV